MTQDTTIKKSIAKIDNEPSWFSSVREGSQKAYSVLSDKPVYGLGIIGKFLSSELSGGEVEYETKGGQVIKTSLFENREYDEILQDIIKEAREKIEADKIFSYNIASLTDGIVLEIPEGKDVGDVSLHAQYTDSVSDMVVIVAKKGSSCRLSNTVESKEGSHYVGRTLLIIAEEDAKVVITNTVSGVEKFSHFVCAKAQRGATITYNEMPITDTLYKSNVTILLSGDRAETKVHTGSISTHEAYMDLYVDVIHRADNTRSFIRSVGSLMDSSEVVMRHNIIIDKNIKNIDAKQHARFYIFGEKARLDTIPALDIASKEVSCQHGLEISTIGEEELFYPKLRGFENKESIAMLIEGALLSLLGESNTLLEAIKQKIHRVMYTDKIDE